MEVVRGMYREREDGDEKGRHACRTARLRMEGGNICGRRPSLGLGSLFLLGQLARVDDHERLEAFDQSQRRMKPKTDVEEQSEGFWMLMDEWTNLTRRVLKSTRAP